MKLPPQPNNSFTNADNAATSKDKTMIQIKNARAISFGRSLITSNVYADDYERFLTLCGFHEPKVLYAVGSCAQRVSISSHYFRYAKGFVKKVGVEFGTGSIWHKLAQKLFTIYARSFYRITGRARVTNRLVCRCDIHQYEYAYLEDALGEWLTDVCEAVCEALTAEDECKMRVGYYCADLVNGVHYIGDMVEDPEATIIKPCEFYEALKYVDEPIYTFFHPEHEAIYDLIEEEYGIH